MAAASENYDEFEFVFDGDLYSVPLETLLAAEPALDAYITQRALPELRKQYDLGRAEFLGEGHVVDVDDHDPHEIAMYRVLPGGLGKFKVTLPPAEYPELYMLKEQLLAVRRVIHDREHHLGF